MVTTSHHMAMDLALRTWVEAGTPMVCFKLEINLVLTFLNTMY